MADAEPPQSAVRNIDAVVRLEEEAVERRTVAERVADRVAALAGTLGFAAGHALLVAVWAAINLGAFAAIPIFDPFPFGLLGGLFSLEGVLLASFVLIKQNRLGAARGRTRACGPAGRAAGRAGDHQGDPDAGTVDREARRGAGR